VVLEKDGETQLERHCRKRGIRVNKSRKYPKYNKKGKAKWIGHILRRNCLLKQVSESKITEGIEVTEKRGTKRKKLLDELKETRRH
jgi:hypothetical protein